MNPRSIPSRSTHRLNFCLCVLSGVGVLVGSGAADAHTKSAAGSAVSAQVQDFSAGAQSRSFCQPSPEVKASLDEVFKKKQEPDQTDYEFWRSQQAAIQDLRRRYPNNFFVEQDYLSNLHYPDPSTGGFPSETGALRAVGEYKALTEQHPDDMIMKYLYATTLVDRDTPTAIKLLDEILRKKPEFPWPHNSLLEIYSSPNFLDKVKAQSHLLAILSACPANIGAYSWLRWVGDDELIRKRVPQLRSAVETRTDIDALWEYQTLWSLEFKSRPRSEYDALRNQVSSDLVRIRALKLEAESRWWYVLSQGYQLAGDQQQAKWAQDGMDKHIGLGSAPASMAISQWLKDHPNPKPDDPKEKKLAHSRDELKQTDGWIKQWPISRDIWERRMSAMAAVDDLPPADCANTLETRLRLEQANNGPLPLYWWTYFEFADFLSKKKIEPAREIELAQKGLDTIVTYWENIAQKDLNSTKDDLDYYPNFYWPFMKARGLLLEAEGYTQLKQLDSALVALGKVNLQLQALNSDMSVDESRRGLHNRDQWYHRTESQYWQGIGRVAELQARKTDAMAYFQSALLARFESDQMPSPEDKDELGDEAHQLWAAMGGSEDGWNTWYVRRANVLAKQTRLEWEKAREPLPSFELTDLHGRTWKPADLGGKVVFLNFWASW